MTTALEMARLVLGSAFVLLAPGLAWSFVFFPRRRPVAAPAESVGIDWIERIALSFGLSIAVVPISLFFLNYFLRVPVNTVSVILVVAGLAATPLAYRYLRRAWAPRRPPPVRTGSARSGRP